MRTSRSPPSMPLAALRLHLPARRRAGRCSRSRRTLFPIPPFNGPSLRWYEAVLSDARLTSALFNSLVVAICHLRWSRRCSAFSRAWGFARFTLPASALLRGLITLPLTVSYLIIGMGLLVVFNWLGVPKSLLAAGIGHVVINLPLCFAIIYSQMGDAPDQHRTRRPRPRRDANGRSCCWSPRRCCGPPSSPASSCR